MAGPRKQRRKHGVRRKNVRAFSRRMRQRIDWRPLWMLGGAVLGFVLNSELMQSETAAASFTKPAALIWLCHAVMAALLLAPDVAAAPPTPAAARLTARSAPIVEISLEYFVCNWLFVMALPLVGVSVTNAIYQGGLLFVYALSILMLGERATAAKTIAVAISCAGLLLLVPAAASTGKAQPPPAPMPAGGGYQGAMQQPAAAAELEARSRRGGSALALLASFAYALFKVRFKQLLRQMDDASAASRAAAGEDERCGAAPPGSPAAASRAAGGGGGGGGGGEESAASTLRLLGLVGRCTLAYLWPILLLLHASGLESLGFAAAAAEGGGRTLAATLGAAAVLALTAAIALGVNVLSSRALALTSPLFMSLGLSLSIPAASAADFLLRGVRLAPASVAGSLLVLLSIFLMAAFGERRDDRDHEEGTNEEGAGLMSGKNELHEV